MQRMCIGQIRISVLGIVCIEHCPVFRGLIWISVLSLIIEIETEVHRPDGQRLTYGMKQIGGELSSQIRKTDALAKCNKTHLICNAQ